MVTADKAFASATLNVMPTLSIVPSKHTHIHTHTRKNVHARAHMHFTHTYQQEILTRRAELRILHEKFRKLHGKLLDILKFSIYFFQFCMFFRKIFLIYVIILEIIIFCLIFSNFHT